MLILLGVILFLIGAAFFLGVPAAWAYARARQLGEPRTVICPETRRWAQVRADGRQAARAEMAGRPEMPVAGCSRWPQRQDCDQACAPQLPLLGDDRTLTRYAPWALEPRFLRINNPLRMSPALYARMGAESRTAASAKR